jgi:hypothetical protein
MNPADNKDGRTRNLNPRDAVDHAHALLESALTTTGEDIRAVATQFETLAQEVQNVLDLTSGIVDCVQQDWIVSIVPMARELASSARCFIEERVDSLAAISIVFTGESKMLEKLLSLAAQQRSLGREGNFGSQQRAGYGRRTNQQGSPTARAGDPAKCLRRFVKSPPPSSSMARRWPEYRPKPPRL